MKFAACSSVLLLTACLSAQAQIAQWTFDSLTLSSSLTNSTSLSGLSADLGTGTASSLHATTTTFTTPSGNGSAQSISANRWSVGDYWQFQTSTLGYSGIGVSWDQTSSSSGPGLGQLQFSLNGSAWTTVGSDYSILVNGTPHSTWGSSPPRSAFYTFSYDLSAYTQLNNANTVYLRLTDDSTTSAGGGTVGTTGSDRIDNFEVFVVPEPSTFAIAAIGSLALAFASRRKA